jgi:hypothetical protein
VNSDNTTVAETPSTTSTPSRTSTDSLNNLTLAGAPSLATSAKTEDSGDGYTIKDEESKEGVLVSTLYNLPGRALISFLNRKAVFYHEARQLSVKVGRVNPPDTLESAASLSERSPLILPKLITRKKE